MRANLALSRPLTASHCRAPPLLIGGDKTGNDRFYEEYIPRAERLLREYLAETEANDEEEERGP
jgi:hypothetical protein